MAEIAFTHDEFVDIVRSFASETPELLLRHVSTADIAFGIRELNLPQVLEQRFTVAVVGQMRVGKSTLLNALIGEDIAPTGTTETTATVNWFRRARDGQTNIFRVNWLNGDSEEVPLDRVSEWIGQEDNARSTRWLDFFADTDFLQTANIVDTPGTRSVIDSHEDTTQGFLADKLERETLLYGGRADAVVYAVNPVAREDDKELLSLFSERTRIPGSSAWNSIAVVQKWEHLRPDPLAEAEKKCQRMKSQLEGKVAEVIPTSGLLARLAHTVPEELWQSVWELATNSTSDALSRITKSDRLFCRPLDGLAVAPELRERMKREIPWAVLPFCLMLAQREDCADGAQLQSKVLEASGIDRLKSILRYRFFSRSQLIKASTILAKAWTPCQTALLRLEQNKERAENLLRRGEDILSTLPELQLSAHARQPLQTFVADAVQRLETDSRTLKEMAVQLDKLKYRAESNFRALDAEQEALEMLASFADDELAEEDRKSVYALLGMGGTAPAHRLGLPEDADVDILIEKAENNLDRWNALMHRSTHTLHRIAQVAVHRLEFMLDYLEE